MQTIVNDIHAQLNETLVKRIVRPQTEAELRVAILQARDEGLQVSVAGGRHAMGGQQFLTDGVLVDMGSMNRVIHLDTNLGIVEVEAGIQWPEIIDRLTSMQAGNPHSFGIVQKQTGADRLSIGGALGSNIHGRGLALKPMIGDIESFTVMNANGSTVNCSRQENFELFRLVIGGYGLFGIVTRVKLRLMPRTKLERIVRVIDIDALMEAFEERMAEGYLYGDCQFSTDMESENFLHTGVFSCYRPLPHDADMPEGHRELSDGDWSKLYYLSHADAKKAYETYVSYYLTTSGQRYWSDTHQLSVYIDNYHEELDRHLTATVKGSEMITELYVPRDKLAAFLKLARDDFRAHNAKLIYGTIRLIAKDDESFLAWAREPWVCIVMNLHVDHTTEGITKAGEDFRRLIARAIECGGSYFLTYHRWASRQQVEQCYPQMPEFLAHKRCYDPEETFASNWYNHYKEMFAHD